MQMRGPEQEAREWFDKLGRSAVTTADVWAFARWRDVPENDAAYTALELGLEETSRYTVRPMVERYKVIDRWTGLTVTVDGEPQQHLEEPRARRVAARLSNARKSRD
jgi:hypothetical protein